MTPKHDCCGNCANYRCDRIKCELNPKPVTKAVTDWCSHHKRREER